MYKGYFTCLGVIAQGYADMAYTPAARIAPSEKQQVAGSHLIAAEFQPWPYWPAELRLSEYPNWSKT